MFSPSYITRFGTLGNCWLADLASMTLFLVPSFHSSTGKLSYTAWEKGSWLWFWVQWWISRQQSLILSLSLVSLETGLAVRQGPSERVASPDSGWIPVPGLASTGKGSGHLHLNAWEGGRQCSTRSCRHCCVFQNGMKEGRANTIIAICSDSQFAIKAVNGFEDNLPVGLGVPGADEAASHIDRSRLCECSDMLKLEEMSSLMNWQGRAHQWARSYSELLGPLNSM